VSAPTRQAYEAAFEAARAELYPTVAAFENRMGYALDRTRMEDAARVLACPVKANAPHWQHGRVLYAAARRRLEELAMGGECIRTLDVGTAKGFSALCLRWALDDSGKYGDVTSVDVIDPEARVSRNTVAEVDGLLTLDETLTHWPESDRINFEQSTGIDWLLGHQRHFDGKPYRIPIAFIDGKHTGEVVRQEGKLLAHVQQPGDLAVFDDAQIPGVSVAVASLDEWYRIEYLQAGPRQYAIARRR
jgi:hypothetical protein